MHEREPGFHIIRSGAITLLQTLHPKPLFAAAGGFKNRPERELEAELGAIESISPASLFAVASSPSLVASSIFAHSLPPCTGVSLTDELLRQRYDTLVYSVHVAMDWLKSNPEDIRVGSGKPVHCPATVLVPPGPPLLAAGRKGQAGAGVAGGGSSDVVRIDTIPASPHRGSLRDEASRASRIFSSLFSLFTVGSKPTREELGNTQAAELVQLLVKVRTAKTEISLEALRLLREACQHTEASLAPLIADRGRAALGAVAPAVTALRLLRERILFQANNSLVLSLNKE